MNIQLTFNEILGYVEEKFHVRPTIDMVDRKTLRIVYKISRLMPAIRVNVHVNSVSKELIRLTYDCSSVINGLPGGVVGFIEKKVPKHQVLIFTEEKQVQVHLDAFKVLEKVFLLAYWYLCGELGKWNILIIINKLSNERNYEMP